MMTNLRKILLPRLSARLPHEDEMKDARTAQDPRQWIRFLWVATFLLAAFTNPLRAEEGSNPFGNVGKPAGGPESFPEEDEFAPEGDFGFGGPNGKGAGNAAPSPAPTQQVPPTRPPRGQVFSPPPGAGSPPPSPAGSGNAGNPAAPKSAPKLADYLELDSSVKSLEVKNFDLPDKDIKDVVTLISKWTGKNFILDNKVRGKITIIGPSQVTLQEAYNAFLSALDANGLTTVQSGKFIRIIESAEARRAPVKTYAGDFAPKDDQFITRIFQLKYINADEVQREFRDLTTRQGKLFAYEPTNSIIITDTGSNIQRIKEILETLDVKSFETTLHVLRVKNTSAKQISEMLGEIYGDERRSGAGGARSFRRSALERTRGGGIISKIIPDDQTNSLVILANEAGFGQLKRLVDRLDVKVTDTGRIHVYYCEYAKAEDLAQTLASLSTGNAGGGANRNTSNRRTTATTPNAAPGSPPAVSAGPSGPVTAELDGGLKITSDAATNALVITANSSDYKTLKRVLKKLDIPRLQVFVETAILEVSLDKSTNVGVNAGLGGPQGYAGGFIGDAANITNFVTKGLPAEGATIPIFAGPTFKATIGGQSVDVSSFMGLLNLLSKTTNSSILSTPQIIALDNEKAEFKVQDEIPVQSNFTLSQGVTGAAQVGTGSIDRLKTGIDIKLTPHVNAASRTIRLDIEQKIDNVKDNQNLPPQLSAIQKATTSRVTNTSVVVRDQDYIMLGGLMSDKIDEIARKVPLLGDIPILGWLFKSKTFTSVKTNLVILLRPKIIGTTISSSQTIKENMDQRQEFTDRYSSTPDAHPDQIHKLEARLKAQENRGKEEPIFDYRNNDPEEDETPAKPGEQSEMKAPAEKRAESKARSAAPEAGENPFNGDDPSNFIPPPPPPPPPPDTPLLENPPPSDG